jgi:hypothetical protein
MEVSLVQSTSFNQLALARLRLATHIGIAGASARLNSTRDF